MTYAVWRSQVTRVNVSYPSCECVMSHVWRSHIIHLNESRHTCVSIMSQMWVSRVRLICVIRAHARHKYEWVCVCVRERVISHMRMWRKYEWVGGGVCERVISHMRMWHKYEWVTSYSYFLYESYRILAHVWRDSSILHEWVMSDSYLWYLHTCAQI